jgi:hypothetical protein
MYGKAGKNVATGMLDGKNAYRGGVDVRENAETESKRPKKDQECRQKRVSGRLNT